MTRQNNIHTTCFTLGLSFILSINCIAMGNRQIGPGFKLDLEKLREVDPSLIVGKRVALLQLSMKHPRGISTGSDNNIYVVGDKLLLNLGPDGKETYRKELSSEPFCISVDDEAIYIGMKDHVEVFSHSGELRAKWKTLEKRPYITSIAVGDEFVFIADAGNRTVHKYSRSGELLGEIKCGTDACKQSGYIVPSPYFDVDIDPSGSLWVVNPGNHTLENYRHNGELISSWGKHSVNIDGFCGCCNPSHMAIRKDGSFITAEKGLVRVKLHGPTGKLKGVIAAPAEFPQKALGLDVTIDSDGRILVLNPQRQVIHVYELTDKPGATR
jgi:hypothetical protein